jgi:hypothetical protein
MFRYIVLPEIMLKFRHTPSIPKYKMFWQLKLNRQNVLNLGTEEVLEHLVCSTILQLLTKGTRL